jgi:hypothetical protein
VELQRRFGLKRRMPPGITPHLGSQWWCLTRQTLSAILEDPRGKVYDRYFRRSGSPTKATTRPCACATTTQIESRSLTLSKFDFQGKPHVFYDDHLQLLRRSDCFVARKIWPHADRLYAPSSNRAYRRRMAEPARARSTAFSKAVERRTRGRPGLYMHSRYPNPGWENGKTAARPIRCFRASTTCSRISRLAVAAAGRAGAWQPLRPAPGAGSPAGSPLPARFQAIGQAARLQPRRVPHQPDLEHPGERQAFMFGPQDNQRPGAFMANDDNAQISVITGAWAVPLFRSNRNFSEIRAEAARLQKIEADHLRHPALAAPRRGCGSGRWPISSKARWSRCRPSSTKSGAPCVA